MNLTYDPSDPDFKTAIRGIPGYPLGEDVPIQAMVFESGALFRLPEYLVRAGARRESPLLVVVDQLPIRRGAEELKPLVLGELKARGWQPEAIILEPEPGQPLHTDMHQVQRIQQK